MKTESKSLLTSYDYPSFFGNYLQLQ